VDVGGEAIGEHPVNGDPEATEVTGITEVEPGCPFAAAVGGDVADEVEFVPLEHQIVIEHLAISRSVRGITLGAAVVGLSALCGKV
jgi:hypothetical protein